MGALFVSFRHNFQFFFLSSTSHESFHGVRFPNLMQLQQNILNNNRNLTAESLLLLFKLEHFWKSQTHANILLVEYDQISFFLVLLKKK